MPLLTPLPFPLPFLVDCCLFRCRHHPVHRRCRVNVTVAVAAAVDVAVAIAVAIYVATSSSRSPSQLLPPLPSPLKVDCCVCPSAVDLSLSPAFCPHQRLCFYGRHSDDRLIIHFTRSSCSTCCTRFSAFWQIAANI
jgi:hypothetical protein